VATVLTTPQKWNSDAIERWENRIAAAIDDLDSAMGRMSSAMTAEDFTAVHEACERIGQSGKRLSATLPGYNQQITAALQALVSDIAATERTCQGFGPGVTTAQVDQFVADLSRASSRLRSLSQGGG
jgi:uncharacterized protein YukE